MMASHPWISIISDVKCSVITFMLGVWVDITRLTTFQ